MAVITPDRFDPLRRYVGVRLQQGVPIVDADVNEREDIQKFELRAFVKWFIGDGVPEGGDGFRITLDAPFLNDDFVISRGVAGEPSGMKPVDVALHHRGRCLVNGLDVIIDADIKFKDQPLHASQPGAAALAAQWGVPQAAALPNASVTLTIVLDVWERLVNIVEDPSQVLAGLGESCLRSKREWVVRARNAPGSPKFGDADYQNGHGYYALATIARRAGDPKVNPTDIVDLREQRLFVPPATLIEDVFGATATEYRRGRKRPAISLREAVNALLRGELPSTKDMAIAPAPGLDAIERAFLFDGGNGLIAFWTSDRVGGVNQVFAARLDLDKVADGFATPPLQITSGVTAHADPHALALPNGDLIVVYKTGLGAAADIHFRRAPFGNLAAATEQAVAVAAGVAEGSPFAVVSGDQVVFLYHLGAPTNKWHFRRWLHTTNAFIDATPQVLSAQVATTQDFHAARDAAGTIWAAFSAGGDIQALQFTPATGAVSAPPIATTFQNTDNAAALDEHPFVFCSTAGPIWVFWRAPTAIFAARFQAGAWQPVEKIANTAANDFHPSVVEDADGALWLFFNRGLLGSGSLFVLRRDPVTGVWGQPRQLTFTAANDESPFALLAANQAIWIFWSSDRDGNINPYSKRLVTSL